MENFSFQLSEDHRGLLWCIHKVASSRGTGVLKIKQASSGANEIKKEIVFHQGQVLACLTNRQQEGFANFLVATHRVKRSEMAKALEQMKLSPGGNLAGILIQSQMMEAQEIHESMLEHLKYRVFNWVGLTRGEVSFVSAETLPEKLFSKEQVKFEGDFMAQIWPAAVKYFDEEVCRSYFAQKHGHEFQLTGDFPFPLPGPKLRVWNDLKANSRKSSELNHEQIQLAAVAMEFDLIQFGESGASELKQALLDAKSKLKKQNFFEVLGVKEGCSSGELRKAYFQLVKKYHPDRLSANAEPEVQALSEEVFSAINEAHSTLEDKEKREEYEAELALERAGGRQAIEKRLAAEQKFDEALLSIRRSQFAQALELMELAKAGMGGDPEFEAAHAYCSVMKQVEEKSLDKSKLPALIAKVQSSLKKQKDNADILYYAAILYKLNDQPAQALKLFDQILELNPNFSEAASEARVIRMRMDKGDKKSGWFKKA